MLIVDDIHQSTMNIKNTFITIRLKIVTSFVSFYILQMLLRSIIRYVTQITVIFLKMTFF